MLFLYPDIKITEHDEYLIQHYFKNHVQNSSEFFEMIDNTLLDHCQNHSDLIMSLLLIFDNLNSFKKQDVVKQVKIKKPILPLKNIFSPEFEEVIENNNLKEYEFDEYDISNLVLAISDIAYLTTKFYVFRLNRT